MSEETQTPENKPTFGERLAAAWKAFWRFLIRLVIAVVIIGGIGAAAYFGIPYLYRSYVQPLQDLQGEVAALKRETLARADQVNKRLLDLQDDIQNLRSEQALLANKVEKQQDEIQNLQSKIESLAATQAELQKQLDGLTAEMEEAKATANDAQVASASLQAAWDEWKGKILQTQQQVYMMGIMERLIRARLMIGQHDLGAAQTELKAAAAGLEWLAEQKGENAEVFANARAQVLLAQKSLPNAPEAALQNVEAAWDLLSGLMPKATTPSAAEGTNATPTASPTATPTPSPTPKP